MRIIREEAHTLPVPTPPSLGAGLRPSSLDRPGHDAGKRQLSETLDAVGIYLGKDLFSQGQLYVSMSRVGDPGKLTLMSRHGKFPGHAGSYTDNVVYHEVL